MVRMSFMDAKWLATSLLNVGLDFANSLVIAKARFKPRVDEFVSVDIPAPLSKLPV